MRVTVMLVLLWTGLCIHSTRAAPADPEGEVLILSIMLGGNSLDEGMIAYSRPGRIAVPFTRFMQVLDIPIRMQEPGVAAGWFLSPDQPFVLDVPGKLLSIKGREHQPDWENIELRDDEIYVDVALIREWLGIEFQVVTSQMQIRLNAEQNLPFVVKMKRHQKWQKTAKPDPLPNEAESPPIIEPPRAWVDWPAVDNNLRLSVSKDAASAKRIIEYDVLASGDLFQMTGAFSANFYGSSDGEERLDKRLQLSTSPRQGEARIVLGDYTLPAVPLVLPPQEGMGALVGSYHTGPGEFSRITLHGDALNGWDVELYHNGELIDFTTVIDDNRFEFRDLPLRYGLNLFHMIFYGPQGQRRERVERYYIGEGMNKRGQSTFRAAIQRPDKRLLGGWAPTARVSTSEAGQEGNTAHFSYSLGLSDNLSLATHLASTSLAGSRHDYHGLQIQTNINNAFYDVIYMNDRYGGSAASFNLQTHSANASWALGYDEYSDFNSPDINPSAEEDPLTRTALIRWNRKLPANLAAAAEVFQRRYDSGDASTKSTVRLSGRLRRFILSNALAAETRTGEQTRYDGALLTNFHSTNFKAGGQIRYDITPVQRVNSANLTGTWRPGGTVSYRAGIQSDFTDSTSDSYSLGLLFDLKPMRLSLSAVYTEDNHYRINLDIFSSLQRMNGQWHTSSRPKARYGTAVARAFLDRDADRRFGPGDEPIEGVRFQINAGGNKAGTDKNGIAYLWDIPVAQPSTIRIREGSLTDPFWVPSESSYRVNMRPGKSIRLDFPVTLSGEIDGTVYLQGPQGRKPASNVTVQILSTSGEVMRETRTAYDGFYLFDRLRPGQYVVQPSQEQLQRLGLSSETHGGRNLTIEANGDIKSDIDFLLRRDNVPVRQVETVGPIGRTHIQ